MSRDNKSVKDGPDSTVISSRSRSTPDRNVPLTSRTPHRCQRPITSQRSLAGTDSTVISSN